MSTVGTTVSEAPADVERQPAEGTDVTAAEAPARAARSRSRRKDTAAADGAPAGDATETPSAAETAPARTRSRRKSTAEQPVSADPSAAETPGTRPAGFTEAQHLMLDAIGTPEDRAARALLWHKAQRTGLDPFEQLYLRKDWSNREQRLIYSVGTRIDGFRTVAKNQATYRGQTAPLWVDRNGQVHKVWVFDVPPVAAVVGVKVEGYDEPMYGIARFSEFCPKTAGPDSMWRRMAAHMIAKVAEALAIRKAYPDLLSDIYTADEMTQRTIELAEVEITGSPVAMAFGRAARAAQALAAAREAPGQLDHIANEARRLGLLDEFLPEEDSTLCQALELIWCTEAVAYARQNPARIDDLRKTGRHRRLLGAPMRTEHGLTLGDVLNLIQQQAGGAPAAVPAAAVAEAAPAGQPSAVAVEAAPAYAPPAPAIPCTGLCGRELTEADAQWLGGSAYCYDCGSVYGYSEPTDEPYGGMYEGADDGAEADAEADDYPGDNAARELAGYGSGSPVGW